MARRLAVLILLLFAGGCGGPPQPLPVYVPQATPARAPADTTAQSRQLAASQWPHMFIYQLQNADPVELAAARPDLYIIDCSRDGSERGIYSARELGEMRAQRFDSRVLAYMSIGEAEDYRWYWQRAWDANHDGKPDRGAPAWLGPENPEWRGNYKVRYWDPAWQRIVEQYIDRIVAAGFDGLYLDVVDAFEYWGPDGDLPQPRATAEEDMVAFVRHISVYARSRAEHMLIFVQNGEALGADADYLDMVEGIGREDVWFTGDRPNPPEEVARTIADLQRFREREKRVLTIDYVTRADLRREYFAAAQEQGFLALAPRRALDRCPTPDMYPPVPWR